jgi:hypothetical protein
MAMKSCVFGVAELPEPSRLAGWALKSCALTEDLEGALLTSASNCGFSEMGVESEGVPPPLKRFEARKTPFNTLAAGNARR